MLDARERSACFRSITVAKNHFTNNIFLFEMNKTSSRCHPEYMMEILNDLLFNPRAISV